MTSAERSARRRLAYRLEKAMRAAAGRPMRFDGCALFQANVHRAALGVDPIAEWRKRYRTVRGLRRILGPRGLRGAMLKVARRNGWKRIKPGAARAGDIGLVIAAGATGFAVVRKLHRNEWIGRTEMGYSVRVTADVVRAWNVTAALS